LFSAVDISFIGFLPCIKGMCKNNISVVPDDVQY
jgi:hypothetical protein